MALPREVQEHVERTELGYLQEIAYLQKQNAELVAVLRELMRYEIPAWQPAFDAARAALAKVKP